jgi:hypothetical protein
MAKREPLWGETLAHDKGSLRGDCLYKVITSVISLLLSFSLSLLSGLKLGNCRVLYHKKYKNPEKYHHNWPLYP